MPRQGWHATAVSWVVPSGEVSEHPRPVSFGQSYVTSLINAVMRSPDWDSTAIFLAWTTGEVLRHVVRQPSTRMATACGSLGSSSAIREEGLRRHQTLSFDAYDKFIEDDFLGGQRINRRLTAARPRRTCGRTRRSSEPRQRLRLRPDTPVASHPAVHPKTTLAGTPALPRSRRPPRP